VTKDEKEFVALGWRLIELKVAYYMPEAVHESRRAANEVNDDDFDAMEIRYLELIRLLRPKYAKKWKDIPGMGVYPLNSVVHKGYPGYEDLIEAPNAPMIEVDVKRPSVQLVIAKLGTEAS
jgi:hypothetical protein